MGNPTWDALCLQFGVFGLQRLGIIDMPGGLPPVDHNVRVRGGDPAFTDDPVHPALAFEQWRNLERSDWDLILPSVLLASRMLFDPAILSFFKGLANAKRVTDLLTLNAEQHFQQPLYRFDLLPSWSLSDMTATYQMMSQLRHHMTLEFGPTYKEAFGTTHIDLSRSAPAETTWPTNVVFRQDYLDVLRGNMKASTFPLCSEFDEAAALLRTQWHLAACIVHEFSHAFNARYFAGAGTVS
ncbi:hypothetical protein MBLNU459_g0884t1 [Dothideomycetes sp. NU459]